MPGVRSLLIRMLLVVIFLCALAARGHAQPQESPLVPSQPVALGSSSLPLVGPWHFHPGDSPQTATGPLWAEPTFSDAQWAALTLPAIGATNPGWMGRGYPTLDRGYAWYRLTLHPAPAAEPLWLQIPAAYDDAYQLYANGKLLGSYGFPRDHPVALFARVQSFPLPAPDAAGQITLALRFWLDPSTHFDDPTAGGLHTAPLIGLASTIRSSQQRHTTALILSNVAMGAFLPLFFLLAAIASLWAWLRVRRDLTYLWLAIRLAVNVLAAIVYDAALAGDLSGITATLLQDVVFRSVVTPLWIVFWWNWFELKRDRWILYLTALLTALDFLSALLARATVHGTVPAHWSSWLSPANTALKFGALLLLAVIFAKGFRRNRGEALLALLPLAINEVVIFDGFSLEGHFGFTGLVLGMYIPSNAIASFLLVLTIGVLAIRRFLALNARHLLAQQVLQADLAQASELQKRVLLPETAQSPFFRIETVYLPAQSMGGDFFQILSNPDGATLIVLGDVSGKGVAAAFLVAVLVGAIRTLAEQSLDPETMLRMLNGRLIDRSDGHFATCSAVLLQPDGHATLANAGHLPCYLNGREQASSGSLPLGLLPDADFELHHFHLHPGDRLTMLSDGIVEATNAKGDLFGFDRTRDLATASPKVLADAAMLFGQEDDITVVSAIYVGDPSLLAGTGATTILTGTESPATLR